MCGKRSRPLWPLWYFLALFLSAPDTLAAEDPGMQTSLLPSGPLPNSAQPRLTLLGTVSLLSELSAKLVDESTALAKESREHSAAQESDQRKLSELQTELGGLKLSRDSFKTLWETSTAASAKLESKALEAIEAEAVKAARSERAAARWRAGALGVGLIALAGWAAFAASMIF